MRIIFLGPPGSGKGTQGELIEKKYGFPKISSGDLLRQAVQERTPSGKKAEASMKRGELVNDDIVVEVIKERISKADCKKGYILDGFPRNIHQAKKLEEINQEHTEVVIEIYLSNQIVFDRLGARLICSSCGAIYNLFVRTPNKEEICDVCREKLTLREDDKPEVIEERLRVYHEQREGLVDYYQNRKVYFRIDGEKKIEAIFSDICSILDKKIDRSIEVEAPK